MDETPRSQAENAASSAVVTTSQSEVAIQSVNTSVASDNLGITMATHEEAQNVQKVLEHVQEAVGLGMMTGDSSQGKSNTTGFKHVFTFEDHLACIGTILQYAVLLIHCIWQKIVFMPELILILKDYR